MGTRTHKTLVVFYQDKLKNVFLWVENLCISIMFVKYSVSVSMSTKMQVFILNQICREVVLNSIGFFSWWWCHGCLSGDQSGGFSFTVTDGEHTSPLSQFIVTVRPISITTITQEELRVFPGTIQFFYFPLKGLEGHLVWYLIFKNTNLRNELVNDFLSAHSTRVSAPSKT